MLCASLLNLMMTRTQDFIVVIHHYIHLIYTVAPLLSIILMSTKIFYHLFFIKYYVCENTPSTAQV